MLSSEEENLIRDFVNVGAKAIDRLGPIADELKKYYSNIEDFKNKEEDIKKLMRCGLTIEEQTLLTETDNYPRQRKTEEQAEKMKKKSHHEESLIFIRFTSGAYVSRIFYTREEAKRTEQKIIWKES